MLAIWLALRGWRLDGSMWYKFPYGYKWAWEAEKIELRKEQPNVRQGD